MGRRALSAFLAFTMVVTQMPVTAGAVEEGREEAPVAVAAPAQPVDVALGLEGAYISYNGQTISAPATKVTLPAGADFRFRVSPDEGRELDEVSVSVNGGKQVLAPDADGVYTVRASQIQGGMGIGVSTHEAERVQDGVEATSLATSANNLSAANGRQLDFSLQLTDSDGKPANDQIGERLAVYIEGPNNARVTAPLEYRGNGLYGANVDELRDQNGNKIGGGGGSIDPNVSYKVTLFTGSDLRAEHKYDQNEARYSTGDVLSNRYVLTLPQGDAKAGQEYKIEAKGFSAPGSDTYNSILKGGVYYGVIARDFTLMGGDAETNVAAITGRCSTQTGNDKTNPVEQTFILAHVDTEFKIKGDGAYVKTNPEDKGKVASVGASYLKIDDSESAEQLEAEVNALLDQGRSQSATLGAHQANAALAYNKNSQKYELDTRGRGAGAYYVTLDDDLYGKALSEASRLQIYKDDNQTIVFNVTGNVSRIQKYDVNGQGADSFLGDQAAKAGVPTSIVWNFMNATDLDICGSITGVVLAPKACVKVDGTSSGWLVADKVVIGSGEWHNVYDKEKVLHEGSSATLGANKLVDGSDSTASGFSFDLEYKDGDRWKTIQTKQNDGKDVTFDAIEYNQDNYSSSTDGQDYLYRIRESQGATDADGNSYKPDATVYYAKVRVARVVSTQNGTTAYQYVASDPEYYYDEACTQPVEGKPCFNNAKTTMARATATLGVSKDYNKWEKGTAFGFRLSPLTQGAPMPDSDAITATSDNKAPSFGEIEFDAPGRYEYQIAEQLPQGVDAQHATKDGVVYDTSAHKAVVDVRKEGDSLVASVSYDDGQAEVPVFRNSYEAKGSLTLEGTKTLTGKTLEAGAYHFTVREGQDVVATGTNDASGKIIFAPIEYTCKDVGSHSYTVSEDGAGQTGDGVTYSSATYTVTANVADNGDGTLGVTASDSARALDFVNTYQTDPTGVTVEGTKVLKGRDLKAGEFAFGLYESSDATEPLVTATNRADGTFSLSTPANQFTKAGSYHYVVRELAPQDDAARGGVTYDDSAQPVTINVADNGRGQLEATASYDNGGIAFTNSYEAQGSAAVEVRKAFRSAAGQALPLAEGQFSFTLSDADGNVVGQATNGSDGTVRFQPLAFDSSQMVEGGKRVYEKDFAYSVREDIPSGATDNGDGTRTLDGVTYDAHEAKVTVHVADDGSGTLQTTVSYDGDAASGDPATFVNTRFDATASIRAEKHYFGPDGAASFSYELKAADAQGNSRSGAGVAYAGGQDVVDDGQQFSVTVHNQKFANGVAGVDLPQIGYRKPGDYYYVLRELQDQPDANDLSEYLIRVHVAPDQTTSVCQQLMGVDASLSSDRAIAFYNNANVRLSFRGVSLAGKAQRVRKVSVVPEVRKELKGATMSAGQFRFALLDAQGNLVATATNDATGAVRFDASSQQDGSGQLIGGLTFTQPGEYEFRIVEQADGSDQTINYDGSTIVYHVSVTEGKGGRLVARGSYAKDGAPTDDPTFVNSVKTLAVRVQKRSKDAPYEPLADARYGLWMIDANGNDVYMGNQVSGDDGYMTFDVPLTEGVAYYFKEETAPAGHLVDPYRSAYFTVSAEGGTYHLVYEDDPTFSQLVKGLK